MELNTLTAPEPRAGKRCAANRGVHRIRVAHGRVRTRKPRGITTGVTMTHVGDVERIGM